MVTMTSESHPLRIDPVSIAGLKGRIGLTSCPGMKLANRLTGTWDYNLDLDLDRIRDFGAKALVTLMEGPELIMVRVPGEELEAKSAARGIDWHRLPIRDVHVPDESFETLWTYAGARVRRHLMEGENLVMHCFGGLGRTGTIAARLLVEFGVDPEKAIQEIRMARPGSIQTREQEEYVRKHKAMVRLQDREGGAIPRNERALACLLGGAVGDAFGYAVEFSSFSDIRRKFGPAGIQDPSLTNGKLVVSDDTQMTLFTLEGILNGLEDPSPSTETFVESVRLSYLDWLATQGDLDGHGTQGENHGHPRQSRGWLAHCPELQVLRAPGLTCLSSLRHGGHGTIEAHLNSSKGCGGAMRSAAVGLFRPFDPKQAFELGARSAAITHGHPSGYLSAGMVSAIVCYLMEGTDIHAATEASLQILKGWDGHEETLHAVTKALRLASAGSHDYPTTIHSIGSGNVGEEALAIALYAVLMGGSYVEAVRIATNHDGDSDSTASIAGQLWGAWKGLKEIPHRWITKLDVLVPALRLVKEPLESVSLV